MLSYQMQDCQFEYLLGQINQETDSDEKKLHILYKSKGNFSGIQVTKILYAFRITCDRLKALEIIENRMTSVTACEARSIIETFSIPADQLRALVMIKRHICDLSEMCARENLLSAFVYPDDQRRAADVLHVFQLTTKDMMAAGGHAIFAPFGSVMSQAPPLDPTLYSTVYLSSYVAPPKNKFKVDQLGIETCCRPPAYLDPCCVTQEKTTCSPQPQPYCVHCECPAKRPLYNHYPSGAAYLGLHNPTAKVGLEHD